ncbi:MAG: ATP-binding cassette domain-containing protein [Candidatus Hydrogenedentes bacterium]|nr:ATP-binding cassette domain-containing protein [Candidatus Hydrogenedentota bacterium]
MPHRIEIRAVSKSYGPRVVLSEFSLRVAEGECVTLCGPSGIGKTTLLRLIAGLETPDAGAVRIHLDGVEHTPPLLDGAVGMVFQDLALWPHMRAARHLEFVLRGRGLTRAQQRERVTALLAMTKLTSLARSFPYQMSGGEQQRLAFARAMATAPRVLLLDEPFSNLDATLRATLVEELWRLQGEQSLTTVIATHDPEEVSTLSGRVENLPNPG